MKEALEVFLGCWIIITDRKASARSWCSKECRESSNILAENFILVKTLQAENFPLFLCLHFVLIFANFGSLSYKAKLVYWAQSQFGNYTIVCDKDIDISIKNVKNSLPIVVCQCWYGMRWDKLSDHHQTRFSLGRLVYIDLRAKSKLGVGN